MHKVLSAEDYTLILVMPGTGGTTVISVLISKLLYRGKTALLSWYAHLPVNTVLMKLDNKAGGKDGPGVPFRVLRLGNAHMVCLYFHFGFIYRVSGQ